jgi:thermitase
MKTRFKLSFALLTALTVYTTSCATVNMNQASTSSDSDGYLKIDQPADFKVKSGGPQTDDPVPGQYIVKFKHNSDSDAIINNVHAKKLGTIHKGENIQLVEDNSGNLPKNLKNNPNVEYVEQDRVVNAYTNDPLFSQQYAHVVSHSSEGWAISQGSSNVIIAIVDTGIQKSHPDLGAKMIPGYSGYKGGDANVDWNGHGSHCAGIASAITNNGVGVAGFAPLAKLMPVQVLDRKGSGTISVIATGIMWAADHNADVLSMSFGGTSTSSTETNAINYALGKGKVLVAAMGNAGNSVKSYPAAFNGVIAVGATDINNVVASWSSFGSHISVSAPGVNILSTYSNNGYATLSGTSMATPAVAGLAGLLKGYKPTLTNAQIKQRIEQGTDDLGAAGFDQYYGWGRINVFKTLSLP